MRKILALTLAMLMPVGLANAAERTVYLVPDTSGSPVAAMDEQGEVIWRKSYKPYGEERNSPAGNQNPSYTGKPLDAETGLVYMGARSYDPETARFTGIDPQGFNEGNQQSFGRYVYANNSPYMYVDPNGESPEAILTELMPQAGESFAALTAFGVGVATNDPILQNVAINGMRDMQSDGLGAIGSIAAPPGSSWVLKASNAEKNAEKLGRAKNRLQPDPKAEGAHSTYKVGPDGKTTGYATYEPNPQNPTGFQETKRVDITGKAHTNPDGSVVPTPHVKEAGSKGVRPARADELP